MSMKLKDTASINITGNAGSATTATKATQDASGNVITSTYATKTELSGKVDKVSGKGLSTNDFTSALKTKLESLSNYDDTELSNAISSLSSRIDTLVSGDASTAIESFNEIVSFLENIEDTESLEGIIAGIESKIPTKVSQLTNDKGYLTSVATANGTTLGLVKGGGDVTITSGVITVNDDSHAHVISNVDGLQSALDGKASTAVATTSSAGLMSAADKAALDGLVSTGGEVNQNAFSNVTVGSTTIAADSKTDTLTIAAGSNITLTPDATNDKITIAAKDTTYSAATTDAAGLMSASDKTKLDGIAAGANAYTHPSHTAKSSGLYKITVDSLGHVSAATAVAKSDITALGIPGSDTNTDTKVTSVGNHYTPSANSDSAISVDASSTTAATWGSTSLVTGVNLERDAAGHVTGMTVDSIKMPSNPNTNTTYTFAGGTNKFTVTPSGGSAQDVTVTPSISKNVTYTGTLVDEQVATFEGTSGTIKASGYTIAASVPSGAKFTDTDTKVTSVGNHYTPAEDTSAAISAASGTATNVTGTSGKLNVVTGVKRDAKGHIVGVTSANIYSTDNNTTYSAISSDELSTGTATTSRTVTAAVLGPWVKSQIDSKIAAADAMIYKGTLGTDGTITALPATHSTGWTYKVITAGTYAGKACEVGDMIICLTDGTSSNDAHWTVVQNNIDGAVTGPASSTDAHVAVFNGATGKVIKDSGYTIAKSVPSNAVFTDTNTKVTSVGNHYTPSGGTTTSASGGTLTDITNSSSGVQVVTGVTKDAAGHVTGVTSVALKSVNTDTHYTTGIVAGASGATANASATNPYVAVKDNSTYRSQIRLVGSGATTVTSDASGNITISSTDNNTTYSAATTSAAGLMSKEDKSKLDGITSSADSVSFSRSLSSGTKIGTITINGTGTDLYCQTNTNTTYTAGNGLTLSSTTFNVGAGTGISVGADSVGVAGELYAKSSATTAATAGWYRIATSAASISNCQGVFQITGQVSGRHTTAVIAAGTSYGVANSSNISVLQCSHYSTNALTKVRIVYHTTYSSNYAYLEVYNPSATALPITVKMLGGTGWSLVTPSTAGSVPSGYSSKEATLSDATIYSEKFSGNGSGLSSLNASNISSGTINASRLPAASTSAQGAMTAAMVTKLNGITESADSVSFTQSLSSGTKVGTITINGTGTDIYCQTNTNTTYSAGNGLTLSSTTFAVGAGTGISVAADTVGINSTYQTYISNGNTAYGWGNHASAGYVKSSGVTSVATGAGLTGGSITTSGTIKCKLKSETASTLDSADMGSTASRQYAVGVDKSGYLSVNIPWSNTTYSSKAAASGGTDVSLVTTGEKYTWNSKTSNTGTVTSITLTQGTGITVSDSGTAITSSGSRTISLASGVVTAGSAGPTAAVTGSHGATVAIPRITVDTYGRVTALTSYNLTCQNTTYSVATASANGLMAAADKSLTNFLNATGTATTLASLDVSKSLIYATLSAATSISLSGTLAVGRSITVVCKPTASFTQAIPTSGSYISMDGDSLSVTNGKSFEINILCYTSGKYSISCKTAA